MKKIASFSESDAPQVSICIPVRNGADFIEQAIRSSLEQTYTHFELIVVDNSSTDNTVALVREISLNDDRIRIYVNETDIGLIGNLNRCLHYARGEYIKFVMADDVLLPSCLDEMVHGFDEHSSVTLVSAGKYLIDRENKIIGRKSYTATHRVIHGYDAIQRCLCSGNHVGEPTAVLFRRQAAIRGFDESLKQFTDLEMWFHLLEQGDLLNIPQPLSKVRRHAMQLSNVNEKSDVLVEDSIRLFEQYHAKSYMHWTFFRVAQHKFRMAGRIWRTRKYLPPERRGFVIKNYSGYLIYYGYAVLSVTLLTVLSLIRRK